MENQEKCWLENLAVEGKKYVHVADTTKRANNMQQRKRNINALKAPYKEEFGLAPIAIRYSTIKSQRNLLKIKTENVSIRTLQHHVGFDDLI